MKKIILGSLILLIIMLSQKVAASTVGYLWENVEIEIPVNDKLDNYLNLPICKVYVSNVQQNVEVNYILDERIYSKNTVVTSKIGTYYLEYIAEIPKYHHKSEQRIVFHVVDKIPPTIVTTNQSIEIGEAINFKNHIKISDNYDKESDIEVLIDERGFNNRQVGNYEIKITATDKSFNKNTAILNVEVRDDDYPSINPINTPTEIPYGNGNINLGDYFVALDNYDGIITDKVNLESQIEVFELGNQSIILSVEDSSGNKYIYNGTITIVDFDKPRLELKYASYEVDNILQIDDKFLRNLIFHASDNESDVGIDDVFIDYSEVQNRPGQYNVYYILTDNSNNEMIITLVLRIVQSLSVNMKKTDITIKQGQTFDYLDYIEINKIDGLEYFIIIEGDNVNVNKSGNYYIDIIVIDSLNNSTKERINVTVLPNNSVNNFFKEFGKADLYILIAFGLTGTYIFKIKKNRKA